MDSQRAGLMLFGTVYVSFKKGVGKVGGSLGKRRVINMEVIL